MVGRWWGGLLQERSGKIFDTDVREKDLSLEKDSRNKIKTYERYSENT